MTHKKMLFNEAARQKVLQGATMLADAIRITLGPKSKSVLIQKSWGEPVICNDGVTIAKELSLEDAAENLGVQMLRQAAERTSTAVGDGTSTSTIIAHAIFADGVRNVVAGASGIDLKRGLDQGLKITMDALKAQSRQIETRTEKIQVAAISAHNDTVIGEMVADAIEKVGDDGVITVEESRTTETVVDVVEGMQIDRGFLSPYFINDPEHRRVILEDVSILLVNHKISAMSELLPLLEQLVKTSHPLLLVAEDVAGEALATLVINQIRGTLQCAAIKAPGFGDRRRELMGDIATLTQSRLITDDLGVKLSEISLEQLGHAERVVIDSDSTTLVGGAGKRSAIDARIRELRAQIDKSTSDYDREKLEERLARLAGGVAVIRVGAPTEAELNTSKDAFDDAIAATRAAIQEGIVPGGGLALLRCVPALLEAENRLDSDERTGMRILRRALEAPARQIARNSSVDDGVVVAKMLESDGSIGFDAESKSYVDLISAGIIDPTKVVRVALENAVSVASVLLLTEATMTAMVDKTDNASANQPEMALA